MTDKPIDQPRSRDGLPLTREEREQIATALRQVHLPPSDRYVEAIHQLTQTTFNVPTHEPGESAQARTFDGEPAGAAPLLGLPMDLPAPPPDWKLPVRYDGTDLLDASNRILVWDGDYGERTGRYLARLVNAAGTQSSSALLGPELRALQRHWQEKGETAKDPLMRMVFNRCAADLDALLLLRQPQIEEETKT